MSRPAAAAVSVLVLSLVAAPPAGAQAPHPPYGAKTPQEAAAGFDQAVRAGDPVAAVTFISPEGRRELVAGLLSGLLLGARLANPDAPMPGSKPLPKAELDKKHKDYAALRESLQQSLKPFGLDTVVGAPPLSNATRRAVETALDRADIVSLAAALIGAKKQNGQTLGVADNEGGPSPIGKTTDYAIKGDTATAKAGTETIDFVRVDGRWYLQPPRGK